MPQIGRVGGQGVDDTCFFWGWTALGVLPGMISQSVAFLPFCRFPYLAVSQHDCGIHQFMKLFPNIIVMSAGGNGHVPIPLLKKVMSMPMDPEKRTIEVCFGPRGRGECLQMDLGWGHATPLKGILEEGTILEEDGKRGRMQ